MRQEIHQGMGKTVFIGRHGVSVSLMRGWALVSTLIASALKYERLGGRGRKEEAR